MVDCTGLENRQSESSRGFESLPLRHEKYFSFVWGFFVPSNTFLTAAFKVQYNQTILQRAKGISIYAKKIYKGKTLFFTRN